MNINSVDVDELERVLNRPLFVLKMNRNNPAAGAHKRAQHARLEIHQFVMNYADNYNKRVLQKDYDTGWNLVEGER